MIKLHEQFITDIEGKKTGVVLSMKEYKKIISILEEYEDIKDFDARSKDSQWLSFDEFKKNINV